MLTVEGLRAGYGALEALRGVSLEVKQGQAVAVLGANGAGKTTLMRALTGLIRARAGSITFDGQRIERLSPERRVRLGLALVPEGRELFPSLSVRENLIMGAYTRPDRKEMDEGIERALEYFPRLRDRLSAPAASLSGGEGQMLSIGRALMSRPRVLLLDEPSLGLAPAVVETVFDVIARLNREQGLTVALVEQNAAMALSVADSAWVLQSGEVALHGATADLTQNEAVRRLYMGAETTASAPTDEPASVELASVESGETAKGASVTSAPLLDGVQARMVETPRLRMNVLTAGDEQGKPVVLIHGNVSSARFFEETMLALPAGYWALAPDLRGYGGSETKPVDATRGLRDFSDDLDALLITLGLTGERRPHLLGWSMGGGIVMRYVADHPENVASVTLIAPVAPFGLGGTKDAAGTLCWPDAAGSGAGTTNVDYVRRLRDGDRGEESSNSPRAVMNSLYFKPPFRLAPDREDTLVDEMLRMVIGDQNYPGDSTPSANWPGVGPGKTGVNNTMAPGVCDQTDFAAIATRPPVLWVRGADDQIVSETSFLDFGTLGKLGYVPGWPGADTFPSQPMLAQTRAVLDRYQAAGGRYTEVVIADCGHSPHIEKPNEFRNAFFALLAGE